MRVSGTVRHPSTAQDGDAVAAAAGRPRIVKVRGEPATAHPAVDGGPAGTRPTEVPPWFSAFDLASNTRFTRTPDRVRRKHASPHDPVPGSEEPVRTAPAIDPAPPQPEPVALHEAPADDRPTAPDAPGSSRGRRRVSSTIRIPAEIIAVAAPVAEPVEEAEDDHDLTAAWEEAGNEEDFSDLLACLPETPRLPFLGYGTMLVEASLTWQPLRRRWVALRADEPADAPDIVAAGMNPHEPVEPAPLRLPAPAPRALAWTGGYELPPLDLLAEPTVNEPAYEASAEYLDRSSVTLQQTLHDFGVRGEIIDANPGPVVTLYELEPAPGTKSSRVVGLSSDIARSMSAVSARVAVIPGRNVIGVELPNASRETVYLRELLETGEFGASRHRLPVALGKTIGGEPVIVDLARMPHLLVAGTTGSGKSVAINTMILSLLYTLTPEECRLIMVDPKMLELSVYEGIPHLLTPVVTDPKKAVVALKWAVREMEERYRKMSRIGVRNIDGFNARVAEMAARGELPDDGGPEEASGLFEPLPFIVVIVDEMADLMLVAGKDIEGAIQRLAQMARAAGIHLIMATQRPSVDVITGTIKANFPTRISFQVTSKIDSRTILGEMGAEQLLGQGDMLYMAGGGRITRVHGPFVSDGEVEKVVAHLKAQGRPDYLEAVTADEEGGSALASDEDFVEPEPISCEDGDDPYDQAVAVVMRDRKASTSYIQRRLGIGYNRAATIMERMEKEGIVGPANHAGKRAILRGERNGFDG